ncbi:MAG TPA: bifunctional UDP-sugar hydrolase/5'-nucleotidase [Thermoanaerobaculia bacterium]|jgi:2',3'-cyclic-nucleotide 2'-phosphodiesterase (5'-nucleotidase family)
MKPFRPLLAVAALFLAACATAPQPVVTPAPVAQVQPAPAPAARRFKILQVNDVYKIEGLEGGMSGGLSRLRTLRTHLESDGTPLLLLHAGDILYPSVASKYLEAKQMIDVMNLLDGDAVAHDQKLIVTFGNHELENKDDKILLQRLNESRFQWLVTNTLHCPGESCRPFPGTHTSLVVDLQGLRVGLMGLLYPLDRGYARSSEVAASARATVDSLKRAGARVIVAVTHQDMGDDVKLVESIPGIDVVIGGHDHLFMQQRVGNTWVTKADADVKSAIVYDITVPSEGPIRTAPVRVVVDSTIPKDPQVDAAVQRWMAALSEKLGGNTTIGTTRNLLEGVEPAVRGRETALGNLLADVARERMKTDVGVVNGGGIRINDNIPPGPITRYDMEGVFYYANGLVAFEATGQQLLDMLRNSVSRVDAGDGRFLQVSGLRFRYHPANGQFVVNASDVEVGGKPLDLNRRYSIATVDYLYKNGTEDGYELFSDDNRPPKINTQLEADFRTETEAYIRKVGIITTAIEGRITRQ